MNIGRLVLIVALSASFGAFNTSTSVADTVVAPEEHRRGEDQTYLNLS